ncbi:hypothetical protein CERSUDRAFT_97661 [Gelatoporia subvermispora B]|uniref:Uncharacterized protein n=1 Tax=Ceriporiopsis subvermispora (strain B) TaxID=914234 RepID=M2QQG0_CERS8|nr:hypothetical protein CERSUDRAFT_97661 [Gelatoporia subvermispora B]
MRARKQLMPPLLLIREDVEPTTDQPPTRPVSGICPATPPAPVLVLTPQRVIHRSRRRAGQLGTDPAYGAGSRSIQPPDSDERVHVQVSPRPLLLSVPLSAPPPVPDRSTQARPRALSLRWAASVPPQPIADASPHPSPDTRAIVPRAHVRVPQHPRLLPPPITYPTPHVRRVTGPCAGVRARFVPAEVTWGHYTAYSTALGLSSRIYQARANVLLGLRALVSNALGAVVQARIVVVVCGLWSSLWSVVSGPSVRVGIRMHGVALRVHPHLNAATFNTTQPSTSPAPGSGTGYYHDQITHLSISHPISPSLPHLPSPAPAQAASASNLFSCARPIPGSPRTRKWNLERGGSRGRGRGPIGNSP